MKEFYHVVTNRPMKVGQEIIFNTNTSNTVNKRVLATFDIIDNHICTDKDLENIIKRDIEKWKKIAYREVALEKIRLKNFLKYPSRLNCLYVSENLEDAEVWAKSFMQSGRKVYAIVKVATNGKCFIGNAFNCFDGTNTKLDLVNAEKYWNNNKNKFVNKEILIDGKITIKKIIKKYIKLT